MVILFQLIQIYLESLSVPHGLSPITQEQISNQNDSIKDIN